MAQIDLKNTYVYLYDGSDLTNETTLDSTNADADLLITPKVMASPNAPITITLVDPGAASQALAVSITDERDIVVSLATDGGSAITSTAAQVKTALEANATAAALITIALETVGAGVVEAIAKTTLTTNGTTKYLAVKIGQGNMTFSEKRPVQFTDDRGSLDEVREDTDQPIDVSFDFTWEFLSSAPGATVPTVEEVLKRLAPADGWVNGATDPCRPKAVNIAVVNKVSCSAATDEVIEIYEFYYEDLNHDVSAGTVSVSGRANVKDATRVRITTALTP